MKVSLTLYLGARAARSPSGSSVGPARVERIVAVRATMLPGPCVKREEVFVQGIWLHGSVDVPLEKKKDAEGIAASSGHGVA